ncbi:CDP-glycerol glycerophosphotransferase family protein [Glutamicibacter ardleyensis]|uniref:Glycosyl transferase n=1 Tax=Glutamicibacter ardleyensis TaxID=225894 RepID=A0ABQ2D4V4_9MICC|nr:CDP-glycerol glycerophosphotransferase family protein [Glutamicibacter ardleyensis]GGJ46160.1 glycosyl transferase [Glutamicibacter ardleyensis]
MSSITTQVNQVAGRARSIFAERAVRSQITEAGQELTAAEHVLFFAEAPAQFYQLGVWLETFERLAAQGHSVGVVVMDALSARELLKASKLPVFFTRSIEQIETLLTKLGTRSISYVNNSQRNFTMLRFNGPAHIHLNHGESEKASMVSNQLKAYDYACVAGPAAVERISESIARFDTKHLVQIGRPQLDALTPELPATQTRVLYAPTWEGDSATMDYSSVMKMGESILAQFEGDNRFEVHFRPHPKTGDHSAEMKKEITALRARFAAQLDPIADAGQSLVWADVAICDTSAMAYDAVALNVPLFLTGHRPSQLRERLPHEQLLESPNGLAQRVAELAEGGVPGRQKQLAQYFFATTSPGQATKKLGQLLESV